MSTAAEQFVPNPSAKVRTYPKGRKQLLIEGKWQGARSGKTFDVIDPASGQTISQAAEGDAADIDLTVRAVRRAFECGPWPAMTACDRGKLIEEGRKAGARAMTGGAPPPTQGYFVKPTVLVDTKHDMRVVREEIFGPVVAAIPFRGIDDGIVKAANDTPYGLAADIWTRDVSKAHLLAAKINADSVWVNCYNVLDSSLPYRRIQTERLINSGAVPRDESI